MSSVAPAASSPRAAVSRCRQTGFSLIELMIALVLGLVVIGGATAVFLSNKQSYRSNQALGQIQENARIAFELLARDLRQAALTGCGNHGRVGNVLNNGTSAGGSVAWYANFNNAVRGYEGNAADPALSTGTGSAQRVAGTDSLMLIGIAEPGLSLASHVPSTATIKLNESNAPLQTGDLIVVCDPDHAAITQVTSYTAATATLVHAAGASTPGNCSRGLGFPTQCTAAGNPYQYAANAQVAALQAVDWYIGNNPQRGRSLYRMAPVTTAGAPTPTAQEMVRNVTDLQLRYHLPGNADFADAAGIAAAGWLLVDAVRLTLSLQSADRSAGADAQPLARQIAATVALRNRTN